MGPRVLNAMERCLVDASARLERSPPSMPRLWRKINGARGRLSTRAYSIDLWRHVAIEPAGVDFGQRDGVDQEPCIAALGRGEDVLAAALLDNQA
jgi:hypothetical protein